jgi:peptide/nickel transport system permease protein
MSGETQVSNNMDSQNHRQERRFAILRGMLRRPSAVICSIWLIVVLFIGIFAPVLSSRDPNSTDLSATNTPPFTPGHILGADGAGRDVLRRLIWGARQTLLAILVVTVVSLTLGVISGLIAGYYRGKFETVVDFVSDILLSMPSIVLLIALYAVTGPNILVAMAVFGVLMAPSYYRLVRSIVLNVRNELYVDAAKVVGLSDRRIIGKHVLWAVRAPIIIQTSFIMASGIGTEAGVSFLGLGDPKSSSWGIVLQESFNSIYNNPLIILWPAIIISGTILCLVIFGNSLSDVLQSSARAKVLAPRKIRKDITEMEHKDSQWVKEIESAPRDVLNDVVLSIQNLHIGYPTAEGGIKEVVHGVNLDVRAGEIHGLVGESGSGKSQIASSAMGILPKEAIVLGGHVLFHGIDILNNRHEMSKVQGLKIGYVPQEPMNNLDPSFTVGQQLVEGIRAVSAQSREDAHVKAIGLLKSVGITDAEKVMKMYPHQISGGMAQRVLICGALAGDPELIIADEPTTALDVTVQAEVLDILRDLSSRNGLSMIFVTHNLGVVADVCDQVSVMCEGKIVEEAPLGKLFAAPQQEYTKTLLKSAQSVELIEEKKNE